MSPTTNRAHIRKLQLRRKLSIAAACLVVVAVAVVSFLPADTKHALHTRGRFHSWGHFLIFSVVGYIAAGIARSPRARVLFFIGCLVFGFGIELAEHIVYQSGLEWKDVIVDAVGAGFGTVLALVTAPKTAD